MDHALLVSFLHGGTTPQELHLVVGDEAKAYDEGFKSPDRIGYVTITDGPLTVISRSHMKRFLQSMIDGTIPWLSANYIGDCLVMSGDFQPEDDLVAKAIEFVADDSRPPDQVELRAALDALG